MKIKLRGTGTALITPFHENGDIDFYSLEKLINYNIDSGIDFLVTLGTTGESATLSFNEKKILLSKTLELVNGRVPVVAGFGGNNTRNVIEEISEVDFSGIEAILSVSPYYNKPSQSGLVEHYKVIANSSPVPIILYNVPGRTASNINAETVIQLANEVPKIIGVKEASGNMEQCMKIAKERPKDFLLLSGDDMLTLPMLGFGADGVISVTSNAFPKDFANMVRIAHQGDLHLATKLHMKLMEMMHLLFVEGNPAGIKCVLKILGFSEENFRLPLTPVSESLRNDLINAVEAYNLLVIKA